MTWMTPFEVNRFGCVTWSDEAPSVGDGPEAGFGATRTVHERTHTQRTAGEASREVDRALQTKHRRRVDG